MDREALSPTAGCCDRTYWAWKFVDFPGARFQEALAVIGFLYATPGEGNDYHKNPNVLTWFQRGLEYWISIQYRDGSFDEAYPFERSLAATAFTSFYVSEGIFFVGDDLPSETANKARLALRRAGDWLVDHDEHHGFLSNHLAAAAAALMNIYVHTGDERYRDRCQYFVDKITAHQSTEGWYEEYGGADPGYQTHGSFYLARIHQRASDPTLLASIERSMRFLAEFLHPDGSLGGEYSSRNTQTYYPAAFEMLADDLPIASGIADRMRSAVESASAAGLRSVDTYNYFPFLNNLVFAHLAYTAPDRAPKAPELPDDSPGLLWMPRAGIARVRTPRYEAYVGTRKGGVIKVFDRLEKRLAYSDCGYVGQLGSNRICSTQYEDDARKVEVDLHRIVVDGGLAEVAKPVMKPLKFMAFRAFNMTAGQVPSLAFWMKNLLVKTLIYKKRQLPVRFERTIELSESSVRVRDRLHREGPLKLTELRWEPVFTTIHMGSSRYFVPNELETGRSAGAELIDPARLEGDLVLERDVRFETRP